MSSTAGGSSSSNHSSTTSRVGEKGVNTEKASSPVDAQPFLTYDLDGVVEFLNSRNPKNIIVMQGAGISVAAGIPDFRTPGTGLYSQVEKYNLPTPESLFTLDYLKEKPEAFFRISKELNLWPGAYAPTHVHHLVKLLQDSGRLLRCYTQNIDCLERAAGVDPNLLVEAHGTFSSAHCINCKAEADIAKIRKTMDGGDIPYCDKCGGIVKPDVVFFGEGLPSRFGDCVNFDAEKADMLIVIGTSLKVQPFSLITRFVERECPRVLINNNLVGQFLLHPSNKRMLSTNIEEGEDEVAGEVMEEKQQEDSLLLYRDVFLQGDCQQVVQRFAQKLGLGAALEEAYQRGKVNPGVFSSSSSFSPVVASAVESGVDTGVVITRGPRKASSSSSGKFKFRFNSSTAGGSSTEPTSSSATSNL